MENLYTVDARGLVCPQPVLETKRVLDQSEVQTFRLLVDNSASRDNVARFARSQGCSVEIADQEGPDFAVTITRSGATAVAASPAEYLTCPASEPAAVSRTVVYIGSDSMGKGDQVLGEKLMRGFLRTWIDNRPLPWRMILINSGVKLATVDEDAVEALNLLGEKGVEILSCGTCLQHFGLEDQLKVGKVTNMYEVIESLNSASKVISPD
jgi:selenium metabolism protein YedF